MKITTSYTAATGFSSAAFHKPAILKSLGTWIENQQPVWENNRLGISVTGIFIQVTIAAIMIAVLGMAGAPAWIFTTGIFFAFLADSIAFAQCPMKIILGMFLTSMVVNLFLVFYYVLKIAGY